MFRVSLRSQVAPLAILAVLLAGPGMAQMSSAPSDAPAATDIERKAPPTLMQEKEDWPPADAPAAETPTTHEPTANAPTEGEPTTNAPTANAPTESEARQAITDALRNWSNDEAQPDRRARRSEIAAYYKKRHYAPLWRAANGFSPSAKSAVQTVHDAGRDGLNVKAPAEASDWSASAELALSEAVADYAAQASGSRVDPAAISSEIEERPKVAKPAQALDAVAGAEDEAGARLAAFNPPQPAYAALRETLAELRAARVHPKREASAARASDAQPITNFASLSQAKAKRVEAEIIANMERWRWEPREMGATRLEVNIPQFEMTFTRDNQLVQRARVIVGKTTTPTPVFSDVMQYIIINPTWNVPESIIEKELAPKTGGKLSKLRARGYKVTYRHGQAFVQQPPGEKNALGRVKFVFPNDLLIYMHDTPQKKLFARAKRAFSHGCVRVQDPFKLAEEVLGRPDYDEKRLKAMIGEKERRLNLAKPIPVHVEYFTAVVDAAGGLRLYDDLYGYSAKVREALTL
jgi:murein L,D-transpeptidase YcbB/YkuD